MGHQKLNMRISDKILEKRLMNKDLSQWLPKIIDLEAYYAAGVIRKEDLIDGAYYQGFCRNAGVAKWNLDKSEFVYMRQKFGLAFPEDINHISDDNGYDLFIPMNKIDNNEVLDLELITQ